MENISSVRMPRGSRAAPVVLIELVAERQFTTDGSGTFVVYQVGPALTGLGPQIQDIVIHAIGRNFTTNFRYKVTAQYSYNGKVWTAFAGDALPQQTTTGNHIGAAYSTRTDFGLMIRFQVEVADAGATELGELSATAAIRLFA